VTDASEATGHLDATLDLIKAVVDEYGLDEDRLYATGQAAGCMLFIAMNIKCPDLFAASYLVAGQWDASLVDPMAGAHLWIVVAEGDRKAFPGMNAITDALEQKGAKVSRAFWDGRASAEKFADTVDMMVAEGGNVMYAVLKEGTVVPRRFPDDPISNHMNTWRIAYQIEGIRDWLFRQTRVRDT